VTDCSKEPSLCARAGEYLSQIQNSSSSSKVFNVSDLASCPSEASDKGFQDPKFIETSVSGPGAACGKRVIKVFVTKHEISNASSNPPLTVLSTSTPFPVLVPPKSPPTQEFVFTLFGVTDPVNDCDPAKYIQTKQNMTSESGDVFEFQAEFKKQSSECSQCVTNLCNKGFITYVNPSSTIPPPPSGDSSPANDATNLVSATSALLFLAALLILS